MPDPPRGKFTGKGGLELTREGLLLREVRIEAGGESASIAGKLGRPAFGRGADLQLDVSGPSAARMAGRFRFAGLPAERYRLAGRALDNARAREALAELGLNPLMVEAFRDRATPAS